MSLILIEGDMLPAGFTTKHKDRAGMRGRHSKLYMWCTAFPMGM